MHSTQVRDQIGHRPAGAGGDQGRLVSVGRKAGRGLERQDLAMEMENEVHGLTLPPWQPSPTDPGCGQSRRSAAGEGSHGGQGRIDVDR